MSVDEQLCITKARHFLKQYIQINLILTDISGFAYDLDIYSGQENIIENRLKIEPDLGPSDSCQII